MEDLKRVLGRNAAGASRQGSLEAVLASPAPPSGGTAPGVDGSSPKPGGGLLVWARRGAHGYLDALVGMITGPKGYLGSLDLQDPRALPNALTFFIASVAIAYVLELPFAPKEKAGWIWGATTIVFHCLKTIVVAGVLKMAFRLFGGRAPFRTHLLVVLYTSSVASLLWATFVPASKGIVLSSAPAQYDLFRDFTDELIGGTSGLASASAYDKYHSLWEAPSFLIAAGLVAVVAVMVLAWCILSWGAFRAINDVGRARSFLAWVVANSVGIVVGPLVSLAQKGLGLRLY